MKKIIEEKAYQNDYDNLTMQLLEEQIPYEIVIKTLEEIANTASFR